ncbi:RNA polymerase sigma factor [Qiania dongpingensis]|uniref:Sigma-70 family RNA polymerase sigma factor n=1 Tax=Qiania dongpingensis TaxID=2763669 RepID=A0A7G9G1T4_9FIRM|nr:sigma-70 family RNA polymerase sigma factor [Qiania dongpingensis]QNM04766.1 sigma-70 family RNA polymerase sigma factor [Qiania dongpingensis]
MDTMEVVYQKYAKAVYGFLLSKTNHPDLAEEMTQEVFYQAVKSAGRFKEESSVLTWLCSIAGHVWCNYLRKKKQERTVALEETAQEMSVGSAEDAAIGNWDSLRTLKALHRLEEPMREVMYLRLTANLSFREIGEIMERTENWARVNYYRGKEKIWKEVKKDEPENTV